VWSASHGGDALFGGRSFRDAVSRSLPLEVRVKVPVDPQVQRRIQDGVSLRDLGFGGFSLVLGGSRLRRKGRQPPGLNFGDLFAYMLARQRRRTSLHGRRFHED